MCFLRWLSHKYSFEWVVHTCYTSQKYKGVYGIKCVLPPLALAPSQRQALLSFVCPSYVVWRHECARLVLCTGGCMLCILFRTSPFSHLLYRGALAIIPCQSTQETAFLPSTIGSYQIRFFFNYRCF